MQKTVRESSEAVRMHVPQILGDTASSFRGRGELWEEGRRRGEKGPPLILNPYLQKSPSLTAHAFCGNQKTEFSEWGESRHNSREQRRQEEEISTVLAGSVVWDLRPCSPSPQEPQGQGVALFPAQLPPWKDTLAPLMSTFSSTLGTVGPSTYRLLDPWSSEPPPWNSCQKFIPTMREGGNGPVALTRPSVCVTLG